jgi:hypothetical protein
MRNNLTLHLGKYVINFVFRFEEKKTTMVRGVGNRCENGEYVLFVDYDHHVLDHVLEEVQLVQNRMQLGTAHVFKTKHGYHVVYLQKITIQEVVDSLDMTTCDKAYQNIPLQYAMRTWILRSTKKGDDDEITHVTSIPPIKNYKIIKSNAHRVFLQDRYGISDAELDMDGTVYDGSKELMIAEYYVRV